ncbi:(Fe-S)-binding protein [Geomonas azotofigens]|uniref:(Fe-S)-binding protein n=1 Tax=Geomonas azotofigens TaxID=2843196 RepID=UPI001C0FED84|nr:(Fe-S)-binding protein [Geomonas azotofigens]MBU5613825.1 (Fe-S)-binding protein [Geomonas azotofigens]
MDLQHLLFIAIFALSTASFVYSCQQRLGLLGIGAREDRFDRPGARLAAAMSYAFGQKRVLARPYGVNHFLLFWAFLFLLLANGEFLVEGLVSGASLARLLPAAPYRLLTALFDLVSLVALVSVLVAAARRLFFPPSYLGNDYTSAASGEAILILAMIATLMAAFFLMNAAHIALGTGDAWRPVSAALAAGLSRISPHALQMVAQAAWWVHALVLLAFMNLLPRSKHMHILTAIPNCYFQSLEKPNTLPREDFASGARYGVQEVGQYSWKDLLDSLSCTECGRCQDLCPAHQTGKPLNPRRVVHDIKVNLLENGPHLKHGGTGGVPLVGQAKQGTISEEAIWSCTTCGACTSVCPVLIEQMPKIVKLRRHLVQEQASFPEELLNLFENMEQRSNPWGMPPADRPKWSAPLGDRTYRPGATEYLFFAGCAGAFDNRNKQVTVALANVLDRAGVSWGILGKDEPCCGESLRRLGNEYVFDRMARQNVELFKERQVKKIVTQCPHCFSALKNDYRQFGLEVEVIHHSQLIAALVREGRLSFSRQPELGKVAFHDSCYLGRHNDIYLEPRAVLEAATGAVPAEMPRHRENAFCCGAGGGRMWLEEQSGSRINLARLNEAVKQQPDTLCVSCPYCMTMMEDGLKDLGLDRVAVKDIAEVAADALRTKP